MKRCTACQSLLLFVIVLMAVACGGLNPGSIPPDSFLTGTITYVGGADAWPDSNVFQVRVLAFEEQPTTEDEVIAAFTAGKVAASDTLRRRVELDNFTFTVTTPPRTFRYIVVAMQNGPNFLKDWLMIGVYTTTNDPLDPATAVVGVTQTVTIDFVVDFDHLPPQPIQ